MTFYSRKWVKPEELNANGSLFGGTLLRWIDEEAYIYATCQLGSNRIVTKYMSEINFLNSARLGDIIEIGMEALHFGRTSITMKGIARNKLTQQAIITIEKMVFVLLDENGRPTPHGKSKATQA